jgi:hypothetical protein
MNTTLLLFTAIGVQTAYRPRSSPRLSVATTPFGPVLAG